MYYALVLKVTLHISTISYWLHRSAWEGTVGHEYHEGRIIEGHLGGW